MRYFLPVLAVLCAVRVHARAEPAGVPVAAAASAPVAETPSSRFALAVNAPLGWAIGSFGVSAYVRFGEHLAVRGNLASYKNGNLLGAVTSCPRRTFGGQLGSIEHSRAVHVLCYAGGVPYRAMQVRRHEHHRTLVLDVVPRPALGPLREPCGLVGERLIGASQYSRRRAVCSSVSR
jgi:hypothetical protein